MAATAFFAYQFAGISRTYTNAAGNTVTQPAIPPGLIQSSTSTIWVLAQFTPSTTSSSFDHVAGTFGNATGTIDKSGTTSFTTARLFIVTARRKPGTTAAMVDQTIVVTVNSVEVGRLFFDGELEACVPLVLGYVGSGSDARFALTGANDTTFGITAVDASLQIMVELIGD